MGTRLKQISAFPSRAKPRGSQSPTGACTPSSLSKARSQNLLGCRSCPKRHAVHHTELNRSAIRQDLQPTCNGHLGHGPRDRRNRVKPDADVQCPLRHLINEALRELPFAIPVTSMMRRCGDGDRCPRPSSPTCPVPAAVCLPARMRRSQCCEWW